MEGQETLKWKLEGKMQDLSPFLKSTEKKPEICCHGVETMILMKAVAGSLYLFIPRTCHALLASKKVWPFHAFELITCENVKVIVFCIGPKHSFEVKMTHWNFFGKCLCLKWIFQNLRIETMT